MDKNEELQKWLNDDRYVQRKELETMWNVGGAGVRSFLRNRKIKKVKTLSARQGIYAFYDKQQCVNARATYNTKLQELQNWLDDTKFIPLQEIALKWGITANGVSSFLYAKNIKSTKQIHLGRGGNYAFYDRAECERARPFINQPEKEVEKVEQVNLPEPKEQMPDIIPADTIDLFTMSELESELKQRGVELTAEVKAKINASDMPEMQEIATMLRGNAKTIAIRLSVLNEIAGQLRESDKKACSKQKRITVDYFPASGNDGVFYLYKELRSCPFCGSDHIEMSCEELTPGYWVSKILCNGCETRNEHDNSTKEVAAEELADFWNRRINDKANSESKTISEQIQPKMYENMAHMKFDWHMSLITDDRKLRLIKMAECDRLTLSLKIEQIIDAAWIMGNYDNK